jgi:hypothetical protein
LGDLGRDGNGNDDKTMGDQMVILSNHGVVRM